MDRRFNRARYDAEATVAAFAARLKDAVNRDSVTDDLASVAEQALEPTHVSIWINDAGNAGVWVWHRPPRARAPDQK